MEDSQKKYVLLGVSVVGAAISGYLLYKYLFASGDAAKAEVKGSTAATKDHGNLVLQSLSQMDKEELVKKNLINSSLKYGPVRTQQNGLIIKEDYLFILKQIEEYANVVLYDIRQKRQGTRVQAMADDHKYAEMIADAFGSDLDIYQTAAESVLSQLRVNQEIYNIAQEAYGQGTEGLKEMIQVSMGSPFVAESSLSSEEALKMFIEVSTQALDRLKSSGMRAHLQDQDEAAIYFDMLLIDYAMKNFQLSHNEFKATLSRHNIAHHPSAQGHIDFLVNEIFQLDQEIIAAQEQGEMVA